MFYEKYDREAYQDYIKEKMEERRIDALAAINSCVSHLSEEYALMIAYGFFEEHPPALKIANYLNLTKIDFLAIQEDYENFECEYEKKQSWKFSIED